MIEIAHVDYASWNGELEGRVAAFAAALEGHRLTVDRPAPAEHELVERIVRAGGMEAVTILDPLPPAPPLRSLPTLAFRRRFTLAERGAITLAAAQALQAGDPTLQVWLDDLAASGEVEFDDPEIAAVLQRLVALDLLAPGRPAEILA